MPKKKTKKEKEEDKFIFLTELGNKYAKELTNKITPEEKIIKSLLEESKISFEFQKPIVCFGFRNKYVLYILDFYLIDYNVALEIDGTQHYSKEGSKKDAVRTRHIRKHGIEVKRLSNKQVKMHSTKELFDMLKFLVYPKK
jgi:very-short-patch-repair endonuclease